MGRLLNVDAIIEDLIDREGGFVSNPADRGGPTCFGITEAVARAHGYAGPMRQPPREEAARIYKRLYWLRPDFDQVASRNNGLAKELFNRREHGAGGGHHLPSAGAHGAEPECPRLCRPHAGRIGAQTLAALDAFLAVRGASGETILLRALEALQGERYLRLAERRPANETFLYGWLANRIGDQ